MTRNNAERTPQIYEFNSLFLIATKKSPAMKTSLVTTQLGAVAFTAPCLVAQVTDATEAKSVARHHQNLLSAAMQIDLREIVMGLHWHPQGQDAARDEAPADLDAQCVLFDTHQRVLEVIHPGHPRNANESVVHTGDSLTGASEWDDERIFVFLEALPEVVSSIAFVVTSPTGRPFGTIPGAYCHVSDRLTECSWVQLALTALPNQREYNVATLRRGPQGWEIFSSVPATTDKET